MTDKDKLKIVELCMTELGPMVSAIKILADELKDIGDLTLTDTVGKIEDAAKLIDAAEDELIDITSDIDIDYDILREKGIFKIKD